MNKIIDYLFDEDEIEEIKAYKKLSIMMTIAFIFIISCWI